MSHGPRAVEWDHPKDARRDESVSIKVILGLENKHISNQLICLNYANVSLIANSSRVAMLFSFLQRAGLQRERACLALPYGELCGTCYGCPGNTRQRRFNKIGVNSTLCAIHCP